MAKRPTYSLDQQRRYIKEQQAQGNFTGKMPSTPGQVRRVAGALRSGKRGRDIYGHAQKESRPQQRQRSNARRFQFSKEAAPALRGKVAWRIGPTPNKDEPQKVRGRIPQPSDLIRLIEQHTKTSQIVLGIWGWLLMYLEPGEEGDFGWIFPHTIIQRDWLLMRLRQMPTNVTYTAQSPAYLQLAHDIFAPTDQANSIYQWGWIFQWSVRDV